MGIPEGEEKEWNWKCTQRNNCWQFPIFWWKTYTYLFNEELTSKKINPKTPTPTHIIIKFLNTKDNFLKLSWNQLERNDVFSFTFKRIPIWRSMDFWSEIMEVRRKRHNIIHILKEKKLPTTGSISSKPTIQEWRRNKELLKGN